MLTIIYNVEKEKRQTIPMMSANVQAGFPSPAQDYIEDKIDLNDLLIKHPSATFLVYTVGDSMIDSFIPPKSLLIVDKSITPKNNDIIVGVINGDFTVKKLSKSK